jgi:hypothetical protein
LTEESTRLSDANEKKRVVVCELDDSKAGSMGASTISLLLYTKKLMLLVFAFIM